MLVCSNCFKIYTLVCSSNYKIYTLVYSNHCKYIFQSIVTVKCIPYSIATTAQIYILVCSNCQIYTLHYNNFCKMYTLVCCNCCKIYILVRSYCKMYTLVYSSCSKIYTLGNSNCCEICILVCINYCKIYILIYIVCCKNYILIFDDSCKNLYLGLHQCYSNCCEKLYLKVHSYICICWTRQWQLYCGELQFFNQYPCFFGEQHSLAQWPIVLITALYTYLDTITVLIDISISGHTVEAILWTVVLTPFCVLVTQGPPRYKNPLQGTVNIIVFTRYTCTSDYTLKHHTKVGALQPMLRCLLRVDALSPRYTRARD